MLSIRCVASTLTLALAACASAPDAPASQQAASGGPAAQSQNQGQSQNNGQGQGQGTMVQPGPGSEVNVGGQTAAPDFSTLVRVRAEGVEVGVDVLEVELILSTAAAADLLARINAQGGMTITAQPMGGQSGGGGQDGADGEGSQNGASATGTDQERARRR